MARLYAEKLQLLKQAMNSRRGRGQDTLRPHWPWSRSVPIQFASRCRRSHWWRPRRKTETVQNLSNDVRRMDRCHNFHTPQTARAFQNVKLEHASHQFRPRIIPAMPTKVPAAEMRHARVQRKPPWDPV